MLALRSIRFSVGDGRNQIKPKTRTNSNWPKVYSHPYTLRGDRVGFNPLTRGRALRIWTILYMQKLSSPHMYIWNCICIFERALSIRVRHTLYMCARNRTHVIIMRHFVSVFAALHLYSTDRVSSFMRRALTARTKSLTRFARTASAAMQEQRTTPHMYYTYTPASIYTIYWWHTYIYCVRRWCWWSIQFDAINVKLDAAQSIPCSAQRINI